MTQLLSLIKQAPKAKLYTQTFTSSGTWSNPGVDVVEVVLVGGGGAGFVAPFTAVDGGDSTFGTLLTAKGGGAGSSTVIGKGGGKVTISDGMAGVGRSSCGGNGGKYSTTYPEHVQGYSAYDTIHWNNGGCSYGKGAIGSSSTNAETNGGGGGSSYTLSELASSSTGGGGQITHRLINVSGVSSVLVTIGAGGQSSNGASYMDGADGRCEVYWWK